MTTIVQKTTNNDDTNGGSETAADTGDVDRRGFLKLLGLSGAGLGIGALASSPAAAATKITPSEVVTDQTRSDSLILNSLTADPDPVEQGQLFYRSDVDEIRYSPDGAATKQIGGGADWSSIANKPTLPEGVPTAVILQMQLADAEQRFAATLAQRNYDDMFVDPYVDQSKIASTSDVAVLDGQNGSIELLSVSKFEGGNTPGWSAYEGSISVTSARAYEGSYSLTFGTNESYDIAVSELTPHSPDEISFWAYHESTSDSVVLQINLWDGTPSSGTKLVEEQLENKAEFSFDTWQKWRIVLDDAAETFDLYVDGTQVLSDEAYINSGTSTHFGLRSYDEQVFVDNVTHTGSSYVLTGTVTSVSKDLGYSPDKMQVIDDATVPANTDLSYTLRDENGNTVDVPRSALESDVDTSALTGTEIELLSNFSSDGSSTPTQHEVGWISV